MPPNLPALAAPNSWTSFTFKCYGAVLWEPCAAWNGNTCASLIPIPVVYAVPEVILHVANPALLLHAWTVG